MTEHGERGFEDDPEVIEERVASGIGGVEVDALIPGEFVATGGLPRSGETGLDSESELHLVSEMRIEFELFFNFIAALIVAIGPGTNNTHVA